MKAISELNGRYQILTEGEAQEWLFSDVFESIEASQEWYFETIEALLGILRLPTEYPATWSPFAWEDVKQQINRCVVPLLVLRFALRAKGDYKTGDEVRKRIAVLGIEVRDEKQPQPTLLRPSAGKFQAWEYTFLNWRDLRGNRPFPCKTVTQHWLEKMEKVNVQPRSNS